MSQSSTDDRLRALEDYVAKPQPSPATQIGGTILHTPLGSIQILPISATEITLLGAAILGLGILICLRLRRRKRSRKAA